jgi:hypothetical protein
MFNEAIMSTLSPLSLQRRQLVTLCLLGPVPGLALSVPLSGAARSAMLDFDSVYIPALFLTGSAGKSTEGAIKATTAMQRLSDQWPAQRRALSAAIPLQRAWVQALEAVQGRLSEANELVSKAQWERSHEALEHVRQILYAARQTLGIDYALDGFTAYHTAMEKLANATTVQRPVMEADFAVARALWRHIENQSFDAAVYGLSAARAGQLAQARADESNALSRLSQALRGASDADLLKAAAGIKQPFVRAYLAFGSAP